MEYQLLETPLGWVGYMAREDRIVALVLPHPHRELALAELMGRHAACLAALDQRSQPGGLSRPSADLYENPGLLKILREQLIEYFAGRPIVDWACELDWQNLSAFQQQVYRAAQTIPWGAVVTYGDLAGMSGIPRGARAVGQALGRNPFPLLVPCHRVVSAGGPGGFSAAGGLAVKKALLLLEGFDLTLI